MAREKQKIVPRGRRYVTGQKNKKNWWGAGEVLRGREKKKKTRKRLIEGDGGRVIVCLRARSVARLRGRAASAA